LFIVKTSRASLQKASLFIIAFEKADHKHYPSAKIAGTDLTVIIISSVIVV